MNLRNFLALGLLLCFLNDYSFAQPDMSYFLPDEVMYDTMIPTPSSIIGHQVGEAHVSHDKLVQYMQALDKASDRITLEITGHTHEGRPLLLLTITSPENHANIESIRAQHLQLTDPSRSGSLDIANMPAVFYIGCSIHGNEASGANAGLLIAYHLAAARNAELENTLRNTIKIHLFFIRAHSCPLKPSAPRPPRLSAALPPYSPPREPAQTPASHSQRARSNGLL